MIVPVRMLAFHEPGTVRNVDIPEDKAIGQDAESILDLVFHFGQNDFQPVPNTCSVSVGDVIDLDHKHYIVRPLGFAEITDEDLKVYKQIPRRDRAWSQYARPDEG